jgi:hypothetical protein
MSIFQLCLAFFALTLNPSSDSGLRCTHRYLKPLQSLPPLIPPCKGGKYQISLCSRQIEQVLPLTKGELEGVGMMCGYAVAPYKGGNTRFHRAQG